MALEEGWGKGGLMEVRERESEGWLGVIDRGIRG